MKRTGFYLTILFVLYSLNFTACGAYDNDYSDDDLKVLQEKTFRIQPGKKIKLSGSSGDILITSWDKSEVYIKILGNDKAKEKMDFNFDADENLIEVTSKKDGFSFFSSGIHLRFEIKVPSKFHTNMNTSGGDIRFAGVEGNNLLKTSGGDVSVKDSRGELSIATSGGDITLENVNGKMDVSTSGGDIKGRNFSGQLSASTSGGDINLDGQNSSIDAETSGGDIVLNYTGDNKGIKLATSGGDIRITLPSSFNASAYLNTSGGDVKVKMSTANVKKLSTSRFEGDLNKGGNKLNATTSGGTISVTSR